MSDQNSGSRLNGSAHRGRELTIKVDGRPVRAFAGETIAAALMADGQLACQSDDGRELGVFCNIGICHSCLMTVNGVHGVRTCRTGVSEGCVVETRRFVRPPEIEPGPESAAEESGE